MKKNNKGFVLVETLVVAVFVATVFTFLYVNVLPLIGSYEQEEKYDSIDSKYYGNLVVNLLKTNTNNNFSSNLYTKFYDGSEVIYDISDCDVKLIGDSTKDLFNDKSKCNELMEDTKIKELYITKFVLNKNDIKSKFSSSYKDQTSAFIDYLPTYNESSSNAIYRLIIGYQDLYENDELYYGTIELDLD